MKKTATILLLGILLFNCFGYRLLIGYLQDRTTRALEARLDQNDYDEAQLITIKVPVTQLSYYNPSARFERVDGSVDIGGVRYKYVKRRLFNDSLELLCLPDHAAMQWQTLTNDLVRLANGLQTTAGKRQGARAIVLTIPGVDPYVFPDCAMVTGTAAPRPAVSSYYADFLPSLTLPTAEKPPAFPG